MDLSELLIIIIYLKSKYSSMFSGLYRYIIGQVKKYTNKTVLRKYKYLNNYDN